MTDDGHSRKHRYRRGVGLMLLNRDNLVFVARRIDMNDEAWQMPQGGIDGDETPEIAAMRELEEEIGTNNATIIAESREWLHYDLPKDLRQKLWGGRYKGQKQKWFLLRFEGQDSEINIATKHPEFSSWQWVAPVRLPELIVPFKRDIYRQVLVEFADYLR